MTTVPPRRYGSRLVWPLLAGVVLILAGCGQKGALYLPNKAKTKVPSSAPAAPAPAPAPATSAPAPAPPG